MNSFFRGLQYSKLEVDTEQTLCGGGLVQIHNNTRLFKCSELLSLWQPLQFLQYNNNTTVQQDYEMSILFKIASLQLLLSQYPSPTIAHT